MKIYLQIDFDWWTIMKITGSQLLILLILTGIAYAEPSKAQEVLNRRVNISLNNITLSSALSELERQANIRFVYSKNIIRTDRKVFLEAREERLEDVLNKLLNPSGILYEAFSDRIVLSSKKKVSKKIDNEAEKNTQELIKADIQVRGNITDSKTGDALPGVSVKVKGTNTGASTDAQGNYSLNAPENGTLVISYIGYETLEVPVNNRATVNISLVSSSTSLNEVVVVGYGIQRSHDVTGSVAIVDQKAIKNLPVAAIDQKMVGQVAGVQVSTVTGTPGGGSAIKIRGSGSIGAGNDPLFVIDGFPISNSFGQASNPLTLINPNDIESITILKDASSTAIYGSRGANGVVIVTTKKGVKGAPRIEVNTFTGVQQVPRKGRPQVLNATEFAEFRREIVIDKLASKGRVATEADIPEAYRNPSQYGKGTDWYDAVLQVASQTSLNATISGGSDNSRYSFSFGHFNQDGVLRYTGYERYSIRANIESSPGKKLRVGLNLAPSFHVQHLNAFEESFTDVIGRSIWLSPLVPVLNSAGKRTPYIESPGTFGAPNPLNTLEFAGTEKNSLNGLGSVFAEYEVINGLKAKYSMNINYSNENSFLFNPSFVGNVNQPAPVIPNSTTNKFLNFDRLSELLLTYDKTLNNSNRMDATLGYTAQRGRTNTLNIRSDNYPDDRVQTINAASLIPSYGQNIQEWSLISYLARVNYQYKDRYLLTTTIRSDGSSRFGSNNRYGIFPSIAVGWNISQENFLKDINWLSTMKLRTSYGLTGNLNIGNYSTISNINTSNYAFGGQVAPGRVTTSLQNPDLTWEKSSEFDMGVDMSLFRYRISLTLDYYNRITNAMLYNSEIPMSSGYAKAIINSGRIGNRGIEIALNSRNLNGELKWSTAANIAFTQNKVLALNANNDPIYSGNLGGNFTNKTEVGKPIGQFWGFIADGVYMNKKDYETSAKYITSVPGSSKYKDVDGNGIIEVQKDFAVIGHSQPDFTWGLTNDFSFKNIDFNILLVGSQGGQIFKAANQHLRNIDGIFNVDRSILNRWRSPENPGDGKTPTTNGGNELYRAKGINSSWVENASFMRIQNISLGYTLNPKFLSLVKFIRTAHVYTSVQNLAIFTQYSGANPEATMKGSSVLTPGIDLSTYPLARTFNIGVNFTF